MVRAVSRRRVMPGPLWWRLMRRRTRAHVVTLEPCTHCQRRWGEDRTLARCSVCGLIGSGCDPTGAHWTPTTDTHRADLIVALTRAVDDIMGAG